MYCISAIYIYKTYFKHIHDIFLILRGINSKLDRFINNLNKKQPSIKFNYNVSQNHIAFSNAGMYLHTKIHRKTTD